MKTNKKIKVAIKNKQQKVVNNGDRSKKYCAKILMNYKPKLYFGAPLKKNLENYWFSDYYGVALK